MAQKKKKTRGKMTKKEQEQRRRLAYFLMGLAFVLLGIFGGLKLGFLGVLIANVFRFIGGNTYPLIALMLAVFGLYLVFTGQEPRLTRKKIFFGSLVFYLGIFIT